MPNEDPVILLDFVSLAGPNNQQILGVQFSTPAVIVDNEILEMWGLQDDGGNQVHYAEGGRLPVPSIAFAFIRCWLLCQSIRNRSAG